MDKACHIRWMIRRDMPSVLPIESACFEFAWTEDDFIRCLRQRNCIGMVAERDDRIVGFMVYELNKGRLNILNFAVCPSFRRRSVGEAMIAKLQGKLSFNRRSQLIADVRESNLEAQQFFRSLGFKATSIIRNFYDDSDEDAYEMLFRYQPTKDELASPENRLRASNFSR